MIRTALLSIKRTIRYAEGERARPVPLKIRYSIMQMYETLRICIRARGAWCGTRNYE